MSRARLAQLRRNAGRVAVLLGLRVRMPWRPVLAGVTLAWSLLGAAATAHAQEAVEAPDETTAASQAAGEVSGSARVVELPARTSWVRFLGWSADGVRLAFRAGPAGAANRPGDPCTVVRIRPDGATESRLKVEGDTLKALGERRIHSVRPAARDAVTSQDVLLGGGETVFAVVVRESPAELAVLRRAPSGSYTAVWRQPLARAGELAAWAWPQPTGRLWAIAAEVGPETKKSAFLILVPTAAAQTAAQP